jgi:hypothetical protein
MKKSIQSALLVLILLTVLLNGCAPAPMPSVPESVSGQSHEIYAGFTNNKAMPFIMIHQSGEGLVMTQDVNSSNVTGGVWNSADGKSAVIYSDSNGRPTSAVVGEDVILYSNYTNDTVDLTVIQADGTRTMFQSKLDTDLLNKITAFVPSSDSMVSYSAPNSFRQEQQDKWFWMKNGMYMLGVVGCTAGIVTMTSGTALPVLYALAGICTGAILGAVIKVGTFLKIDVGGLESVNDTKTLVDCGKAIGLQELQELTSCVELYIPIAEEQERVSKLILSNPNYSGLQQDTIPFEPAPTNKPIPTNTPRPIPTRTPRPVPTRTSQPISSPQGMLCGQYTHIDIPTDIGWTRLIFVTSNNKVFGLSMDIPEGYYRIYDTVIDWTPVTYGDGTQADGTITSLSAYEPISSLQSCQQTQQQSPTQPSTSAQQAQISNEVYFAALRQSPGYSNKNNDVDLLAEIPAGDIVEILGGPEQADGLDWWNVSWNGITGWLADHTGSGKTIMIFMP